MDFNKYQTEAINDLDGNISVVATAGSGKTAVIIERIKAVVEKKDIDTSRILAISFSKKACENLSDRIKNCGKRYKNVDVRTFHSLALKIVNDFYNGKYKVWTTMWEKEKVLCDICKNLKICNNDSDVPTANIFRFMSIQKVNMLSPNDNLIKIQVDGFSPKQLKFIFSLYEKEKENRNYIEFEDIVNKACEVLSRNENMRTKYRAMYDYIFVDEYQDVSKNQNVFLHLINGNNNLFVVGDSLQAIYSFRGGDCKHLLDFNKEWTDTTTYNLPINYRCSKNIVKCANQLATFTPEYNSKFYENAIADKGNNVVPVFNSFNDTSKECNYIANVIQSKLAKGFKYNDIAILARTNAQLQNIQTGLTDKGVGCEMDNGLMFWDLPEIKLVLSYLRLAYDINNNEAFSYCINKPNRWLNKQFLEEVEYKAKSVANNSLFNAMFVIDRRNWRFKGGIDELGNTINTLQNRKFTNVGKMIAYLRNSLNIDSFILKGVSGDLEEISEKISNLSSFEKFCEKFKTIKKFLEYVNENIEVTKTNIATNNAVKLMTIHKSKGLEFPIVFITGCSDGLLPHSRSENIDDEKRLFYVAITRAEKELYFTHSKTYNGNDYEISPFITYLEDTIKRKD